MLPLLAFGRKHVWLSCGTPRDGAARPVTFVRRASWGATPRHGTPPPAHTLSALMNNGWIDGEQLGGDCRLQVLGPPFLFLQF